MSTINNDNNYDIKNHLSNILIALGIVDSTRPTDADELILNDMIAEINDKYDDKSKYTLLELSNPKLKQLINADNEIKNIYDKLNSNREKYGEESITKWNEMMRNVAKLQLLTIIKKKANCEEITKSIINALDSKIKVINTILDENLEQNGGNIKSYKHKYLKYKSKYLRIKNNI
jgi:hypothetical protein